MAERVEISDSKDVDFETNVTRAVDALREGRLIIAPAEHAYVFVADAFIHGAV